MSKLTLTFLKVVILGLLVSLLGGCIGMEQKPATIITGPQITRPPVPANVHNIALLLPLSGSWAASGMAVRNGFLAAYYSQKQAGVNVKVVDTNGRNIIDAYKEVIAQGAEVVVGPLIKQDVGALAAQGSPLPVPTLALNTLDDYQTRPVTNLYQFGLLPQDEAKQAATKILQGGHRNVAVIIPANAWGQGVVAALQKELTRLGGQVVATMNYNIGESNLDLKLSNFLGVTKEELKQRDNLHGSSDYRHDIDAVFLVVDPKTARQIAPLVKFFTSGNLPMYATSTIYSGFVQSALDMDLEGVMFCDAPWVITNTADLSANLQTIRNKLGSLWPDSMKGNTRLYALGIDAYNLVINFNQLLTTLHAGFAGATGELSLDDYNHIYRQLRWTSFRDGIPQGL
jgi:uncharacterized protein